MTNKEAFWATVVEHKKTPFVPDYSCIAHVGGQKEWWENGPAGGGPDAFGVVWEGTVSTGGAGIPLPDPIVLTDITAWEDQVKFPDVDAIPSVAALVDTLEGDEKTGARIVMKALEEPVKQIAFNAGVDGSVVIERIRNSGKTGYGFDAYNETYVDMIDAGIVDPVKVTRTALENAASIASMVLTTESLVAEKKEPQPAMPAGAGMGGDMMY